MIDPSVAAHIELVQTAERLAVSAYVSDQEATPLRWRLEALSRSPGGTSKVSQGGSVATADASAPVSTMAMTPGSTGTAVLYVYRGDTEVARDEVAFGEATTGETQQP